ncbi:hypothetical protein GUITHDRAFT_142509 [Guillardia theta CCMP2712]|uniref:Uncharacterized protein n=1 Tax=Guillardia theta (strain CCMP2712) TaxID=905079 RepID=L1IYD0_GUITC|nr:hypothetical protein GUITHDRAFT_142509 [Guillardia theta CCMP2712]EKX40899.1 hypothetical protein GUITHDRAFT_142509 [Guillardia theta CCMP2712]|eukprot:XP_005827879.1 hypothetical protein GUITHDRAFT_142509 [Guillardia theta CCMP2712]
MQAEGKEGRKHEQVTAGTIVKVGFQREEATESAQGRRYKTYHVLLERRPVRLTPSGDAKVARKAEGSEGSAGASPQGARRDVSFASKEDVVKLGGAVEALQTEMRDLKGLVMHEQQELRLRLFKLEAMLRGLMKERGQDDPGALPDGGEELGHSCMLAALIE